MIKFTQRLGALALFCGIYNPIVIADQVVQDDQVVWAVAVLVWTV